MMKTKSIIAGMLSTMLLAVGCSKEHGGPGTPEEGVRTYASFSVTLDASTTRALADVNSVEEETKINTVNIYVFMGGVLEDTGVITLNENNEGTTTLAITTGLKTIYAVVNKSVTGVVGQTQEAFEQQIIQTVAAGASTIAVENSFFMVGSAAATLSEQTQEEAVMKRNLIPITVQRATAKVQMRFKENVPVKPVVNASVSAPHYALAQQNTEMYLARTGFDFTPTGTAAAQRDADANGTCDHLVALPAADQIDWLAANTDYDNTFVNSRYLAENVNEAPVTGNTSYVLVELTVKPTQTSDAEGNFSASDLAENADFWVLASHNAADGDITFLTKEDKILYFANESDASAYLAAQDDLVDYQVLKYTEGKSYYRLNIRDIKQRTLTEEYAVLRNHYYKVNITEISNLGFNTPGGTVPTDPETPLETQTYISAEILIEPWTVVEMNEPLG
jgi:hypothetical protein